jgi:hypothetical protein
MTGRNTPRQMPLVAAVAEEVLPTSAKLENLRVQIAEQKRMIAKVAAAGPQYNDILFGLYRRLDRLTDLLSGEIASLLR